MDKMAQKTEARKRIELLAARFTENISQYKRTDYDEANTRVDFIDPFFDALGWDVANKEGYAEQYREVVREAKVIIVGKHKAPDYSFRIGGIRKFFVEAKKPSVDLKKEVSPAFQLRRYAYTAKLPLSILTDFEEMSVYDTRIKPAVKDLASVARIFYCSYKDYLKNLDFLYDTFSKDAILKGSFDRYVETTKNKRGTSEVDKEFLKLIDQWREKLAKNIAIRNKQLSLYELNFAVQKIIDRIIFLRIAEDRQIEDYGKLQILTNGANVYERLRQIFYHSDTRYNSGLFDFKKDRITPSLSIDDKVIKEIIKSVYYPDSPYEFSVLGVEILGNIYEQFLGKTIRLTPAHQVKVEEKPEVKKAGGVYYTPKYIVDYIVQNTVGEIIKKKTPKQIEKLKILDPACGSGSFLLGAYKSLLDEHLNWYSKEGQKKRALKQGKIIQFGKNNYQLSVSEKQRILTNNIFGVDIDRQAVEVSKLSLLLKLLEGETEESTGRLFRYTQLKLLPDLSNNIKCGNSLIGTDYFEGRITGTIDEDDLRKINPFDWQKEFPDVFANGGFDAVIGNPPYFNINTIDKSSYYYLGVRYSEIHTGYNDIMYYFLYRAIELLNKDGVSGFITSNYYLGNDYAKPLRRYLKHYITKIINFKNYKVFKNANVHTSIIISQKKPKSKDIKFYEKKDVNTVNLIDLKTSYNFLILDRIHLGEDWLIAEKESINLIKKIQKRSELLGNIAIIEKGATSGKNKIFTISYGFAQKNNFENEILRKNVKNADIHSYYFKERGNYLIYVDSETQIKKYPNIYKYLLSHKKELSQRNEVRQRRYEWYRLERPRRKFVFDSKEKIIVPYRAEINKFAYDNKQFFNDGGDIRAIVLNANTDLNIRYILALLNSKLLDWFFGFIGKPKGKSREYFNKPMSLFPIHSIDISNPKEKKMHDDLVAMVDKMLKLQEKYHSVRLEQDKKLYKTQIDLLDNQIDTLVYKLYNLTEKEIKVVEGK